MADMDVQKVKIKGLLFALRNVLGILKDLLIIILMLVIIWQVMVLVPKISTGLEAIGNLQNSMNNQGNSNLQNNLGNNNMQNQDNNQNSNQEDYLRGVAEKMYGDVQQENWDDAMSQLKIMQGFSSQMTPQQQQYIKEIEKAISNRDKDSFFNSFNQLTQSGDSNK